MYLGVLKDKSGGCREEKKNFVKQLSWKCNKLLEKILKIYMLWGGRLYEEMLLPKLRRAVQVRH